MNPPVIDARGQACPQPVVRTARAIADGADRLTTIVDSPSAVENVTRLARSRGFAVAVREEADGTYLDLSRDGATTPSESATAPVDPECRLGAPAPASLPGPTVVLVASDALGQGPDELGRRLVSAFLHTLPELEPLPAKIVLLNSGVHLAVHGSPAAEALQALAAKGVDVASCGTCLEHFEETAHLAVGRVTNMFEIAGLLMGAGKIVRI